MNKNDLADPFWMLGEEDFQSVQLLRHAFDVVQTIDTDHELDTLELALQSCNAFLYFGLLHSFLELLRVDTYRVCADSHSPAAILDAIWRCRSATG